jgi:Pretoxin HINT domain
MKNLLVCFIALAFFAGCSERHNDRNWTEEHSRKVMAKDKADKAAFDKLSKADVKRMKVIDHKIKEERRVIGRNHDKIKKLNDLPYIYEGEEMRKIKNERYQKHLDAALNDISRREKRIDELESKKAAILRQETASCFPDDTFIQTKEGKLKPIMQVKAGDMVMAFDIGTQTNVSRRVLETYQGTNNHYYLINGAVKATAYERFLTTNGWKKVIHLKKGDIIQTNQGFEIIDSLSVENGILEVYNLQVEESHTFYVVGHGDKLYIVHNSSEGGSK